MARLARIEYEEKMKRLVPVAEVRSAAFRQARVVRDRLLAIPGRLAAELASLDDARRVESLLDAEIGQALEELAGSGDSGSG